MRLRSRSARLGEFPDRVRSRRKKRILTSMPGSVLRTRAQRARGTRSTLKPWLKRPCRPNRPRHGVGCAIFSTSPGGPAEGTLPQRRPAVHPDRRSLRFAPGTTYALAFPAPRAAGERARTASVRESGSCRSWRAATTGRRWTGSRCGCSHRFPRYPTWRGMRDRASPHCPWPCRRRPSGQ